jgi:hypothetical protein
MNPENIISLFRYFSNFVPVSVLKDIFIQPTKSQSDGYELIKSEVLADPDLPTRIKDITKFVLSANERFVSERIKNTNGFILFVEYGAISADFKSVNGVSQHLAVTVARSFSDSNHDNVNEMLWTDRCLDILMSIIRQMFEDQGQLDFCPSDELIKMPVDIQVVDPVAFYGCGGWSAMFQNSTTMLL